MIRTVSRIALAAVVATASVPSLVGGAAAQTCVDVATFAGSGVGDGGPASQALLSAPRNAVVDGSGNIFVADSLDHRVRRIAAGTGVITTIAGNGAPGRPLDGDVATLASLNEPSGLALDTAGNLYIADLRNDTVWQLTPDGKLHRVAGSGIRTGTLDGDHPGQPGNDPTDDLNDGQQATFATLNLPARVAVDGSGNVFIADTGNNRIRRVDAGTKLISSVAGNGIAGPAVDGPATASSLNRPIGIAFGTGGELFIADTANNVIRKLAGGTLTTVAGNGVAGFSGNGGPALAASFNGAAEIAVDPTNGDVFIADTNNNQIRRLTVADGLVNAVTGDGNLGFRDNVPGFLTEFRHPGVTLAPDGSLVIPDTDNNRIRRYDRPPADHTTTVAGTDSLPGDGGPATAAILNRPTGLALDGAGNVYVSEHDSHRVRKIDTGGTITTVVNQTGNNAAPADGTSAINAPLQQPTGIAFDGPTLVIADANGHQIYAVDATGVLHFLAGNGSPCTPSTAPCGDNGPAVNAMLNTPLRVAIGPDGALYIADFNDNRIRRVDPGNGVITTIAGTGASGQGDGPAGSAQFRQPAGLVFDKAGQNLYVADFGNHRVRKIANDGTVTTVAGTGTAGALGDGGSGATAQLNAPTDLAFAADGALLIVDQNNNKIRRLAPNADGSISGASTITTLIGDGRFAFADGPGPRASLLKPTDIEVDAAGRILIADRGNQRVRIATSGTDCVGTGAACKTTADCDDHDACTVDTCQAGTCQAQRIGQGDCQPRCAAEPNGCIPGTGPAKNECLTEALVRAPLTLRRGRPLPVVRCHRGDGSCDHGTAADQCTFLVAWCLNATDPRLRCTATGVTRFRAPSFVRDAVGKLANVSGGSGTLAFSPPFTTADACTELMAVSIPLRKHGKRPGARTITATAFGVGKGRRDVDKLRLVCLP